MSSWPSYWSALKCNWLQSLKVSLDNVITMFSPFITMTDFFTNYTHCAIHFSDRQQQWILWFSCILHKIHFLLTVWVMIFDLIGCFMRKANDIHQEISIFHDHFQSLPRVIFIWVLSFTYGYNIVSAGVCNSSFLNDFIFSFCEARRTFSKHASPSMYYALFIKA